ncbi:MAG TPA: sugar ABC transporter substrate-binding protein [Armatimonadota bacterium]|nr:sugar ABC transporter substrate-binding protein [Armatimonadota bacterium]
MKAVFAGIFAGLILLSVVAWKIQPQQTDQGKEPLVWVSDDNPARRGQIDLFNRLHPKFSLRLDPSNSGMEKVIVQALAGVGPDLFDCYDGYQLSSYVKSGIAWDLTQKLPQVGVDVQKITWPSMSPNYRIGNHIYGFPNNASVNALWYNKDVFDKAGIPYPKGPWTWQQFIPLAQRLTVRDSNGRVKQYGLLCDWYNWQQFILQWGGKIYSEDGTRCTIDSPQAIAGVQFLHDMIYKYHVMPSPVEEAAMASQGGWGTGTMTFFGGGRGAMALGGRWWLCSLRTYQGLHLGAVECPHGPLRLYRAYGKATLVNSKSPRREEALNFLKYEASKPYNDLINHQADALAPVIRFCNTPEYMHDPEYPQEDFNAVWRDVMQYGVADQVNPFVNGQRAMRILNKQLDLVKSDQKPVAEALKTAAEQINLEIQDNLSRDPSLRALYQQLTQRKH